MKNKEKDKILGWIREGKKYKECKDLAVAEGIKTDFHNSFYKWQQKVNPTEKVDEALGKSAERRAEREDKKKTQQRKAHWSPQKQKSADDSKLAELINTGIYHGVFPFCKSQELKVEDVKEINLGGAVVGSVLYFFPDINLDHPLIVLTTRGILFYIRFRTICSQIREKVEDIKGHIPTKNTGGVKEDWRKKAGL
jgi:hypothetical protein